VATKKEKKRAQQKAKIEARRARRAEALQDANRQELFERGEAIDAEERAKGVTESELIRRRMKCNLYMVEMTLLRGEFRTDFILANMMRIMRGQEPLTPREARELRPARGLRGDPRRR
jgi:hypothetical protein